MNVIVKWIKTYLKLGIAQHKDPEFNQQVFVSNLFALIGYSITFTMAVSATIRGNVFLAVCLFAASALFFIAHHIHRFGNLRNSHKISQRIIYVCLLALMLYLVHTGGHANTGPLWIYIVPPVAYFFGGMRKGLFNIGIFTLIVSVLLFVPYEHFLQAQYTFEFKSRLIYSFLTVSLLFGFYEYSRQKSYKSLRELSDEFERQAMHDPLTHLPNRRAMMDYIQHEYGRSQRNDTDMSILLCDIDHFKAVNDNYGHDGGDCVLQKVSELFVQTLRKQDKVARWGGEEFLFLLPETDVDEAQILAEKLRRKIADTVFSFKQKQIAITVSFGVKQVTQDMSIEKAVSIADKCLYAAKNQGRNQTVSKPE